DPDRANDQAQIEKNKSCRGYGEDSQAVENRRRRRGKTDEKYGWKNDPIEMGGEDPRWAARSQKCVYANNLPRKNRPKTRDHRQEKRQVPKHPLRKGPRFARGVCPKIFREYRDERSAERTLPHHTAYKSRYAEGEDEGVGRGRCAEEESYPLIA